MPTASEKISTDAPPTNTDPSRALLDWGWKILAAERVAEARRSLPEGRAALHAAPAGEAALEPRVYNRLSFQTVVEQLQRLPSPLHAAPEAQPVSVHELAPALFSRYEIEGGRVHLAGCQLEDRPVIRLTFLAASGERPSSEELPAIAHRYFVSESGGPTTESRMAASAAQPLPPAFDFRPFPDESAAALRLELLGAPPPRVQTLVNDRLIRAMHEARQACFDTEGDPLLATFIWCKYAVGKLRAVVGEHSVDLPFEGWAAEIQQGTQLPPAWTCPWTGLRSYRLAATDDGRITAAEAIAQCYVTGRRVLRAELEMCAATGFLALPEYLATCPVTGDRLLQSELRACSATQLAVSPRALRGGRCAALRTMKSIRKDDPRLARLLAEYPTLDAWGRWKLAETSRADFFYASQWMRQLLLVVDRESLEPLSLTTADTWFSNWRPADATRKQELLGR